MSGIFSDAISFWRMTVYDILCLIHGISERRIAESQMDNIRAGNQLAMMANLTPRKSNKVYKWTDFYADMSVREPQSDEEIADRLLAYFGALSGATNNGS